MMPIRRTTVPLRPLTQGRSRALIERAILAVQGVHLAYVNPVTEMAYVEYDSAQCEEAEIRAAVARTGFGEPEPAPPPASRPPSMLDVRRFSLSAGLVLAGAFALSVLPRLAVARLAPGHRIWRWLLPGLDLSRWASVPIGLVVSFVCGLAAGSLFAVVYNTLGRRRRDGAAASRPAATPNSPAES